MTAVFACQLTMPAKFEQILTINSPMNFRFVGTLFVLATMMLAAAGCSQFSSLSSSLSSKRTEQTVSRVPTRAITAVADLPMSSDMVALEIAVARLDGQALELFDDVWLQADMQTMSLPIRQQLDRHGFRAGLLGTQLPGELNRALSWSQALLTEDGDVLFNSKNPLPPVNQTGTYAIKRIEQLNSGESHWIPCSPKMAQVLWQVESDRANNLTSRSGVCESAQCGFVISQVPVGDDSIKLWLRPEIRHGEARMRYGVDQETLLIREQQKRLRLDELDFFHHLRLGQTLILSTTSNPAGLGQQFFATGQYSTSRHVILIRPMKIGRDDLFGPDQTTRRLTTSLD